MDRVRFAHVVEYAAFRVAVACARALGEARAVRLAAALGRAGHRLRLRRGIIESNLRQAFPGADSAWIERTAVAAWAHLGRETMMMLRLSRATRAELLARTRLVGEARAAADYGRGGGVIVVTGHLGNWEVGGAAVAVRGYDVVAIAKRAANPLFYRRILAARARLGVGVIDFERATRGALKALREGKIVAFAADQHAGSGISVPFFGRPAATFRGPAVLALRTGAPIYLATCIRLPDGVYEVALQPVDVTPTGDMEADVRRVTAAWVGLLEAAVRAHPGQYLWHHRRWREPVPGMPQEPGVALTV
jgi:KDO2-lipid IV(A) lauroyltransferase